ncbi:MAG: SDR family oxidoreductase [Patescibacteria group bacterium]
MREAALIIGGTKGLGAALGLEVYQHGLWPIIAGRSALKPEVKSRFPKGTFCPLDVTDPRTFRSLADIKRLSLLVLQVYWVSGVFRRMPFLDMKWSDIDAVMDTNFVGGLRVLLAVDELIPERQPYHLVVVASSSSWRLRKDEAVYCASKAAQVAFARNFAGELTLARPGSRVTLVNPGGMKTKLFEGSGQDTSGFMDPAGVAEFILTELVERPERHPFLEAHLLRTPDGGFVVRYGPQLPEQPYA